LVSEQKELGVLFADISDSSYLFKAYGDEGARQVLLECLDVMRGSVNAGPGRVVERIGDELLTAFPSPDTAAEGAIDLQTAVATARGKSLPSFLSLRIGFHFGPVTLQEHALFGQTVYTANRVCSLARGNQILTTQSTVERLSAHLQLRAQFVGERTLKGTHQVLGIYRIAWDDPALTEQPPGLKPSPDAVPEDVPEYAALELTFGDRQIRLSPSNPVCLIGRSERCDLMLRVDDVSRVHTRIEYRSGLFVVVDQSKNGTLIQTDDGTRAYIREDEARLHGSGVIQASQSETTEIRYLCIEATEDRDPTGDEPPGHQAD
jgi:adenylate cyclase